MSSQNSRPAVRLPRTIGAGLHERVRQFTVGGLRAAAFWTAVFLPLAYVPVAYLSDSAGALLALLALHLVSFVLGHEHNLPDAA
ncbi:hypothetical protein [Halorubrum vacuolatum]|uniref:Uncharacterized protein n=1 Tax=Halorubrum vacuolatum TaxID=63740 RepID=A0A238W535_HALVU|nr:hypothetical protein [Halorubrum vacuolatum]SNR41517.1 hypothetical protein SAMN06264855_105121 [Halorubrum vacuolatum]